MIQINLLPDVKVKYIKARRTKHMVLVSSIIISGAALGIVAILATVVYGAQKIQLSYLNKQINTNSTKLQKIDGLNKVLTIQNQLSSLDGLHAQKPVTSRLFTFLPQITPNEVEISTFDLKFDDSSISITGSGQSIEAVNKFVDTLKFTTYTTDQNSNQTPAFSSVVLTSFSTNETGATYTINLNFDPGIFSSTNKTVTLAVPKITSTRSQTENPDAIFKAQLPTTQQGQ